MKMIIIIFRLTSRSVTHFSCFASSSSHHLKGEINRQKINFSPLIFIENQYHETSSHTLAGGTKHVNECNAILCEWVSYVSVSSERLRAVSWSLVCNTQLLLTSHNLQSKAKQDEAKLLNFFFFTHRS